MKTQHSNLLTMIAAALLYGGWAFYINASYNLDQAILSALAQGVSSFFITGFLIVSMKYCFFSLRPSMARLVITAIVPVSLLLILVAVIHMMVGTPRIVDTLLPSTIIGYVYSCLLTASLHRVSLDQVEKK